MRESCDIARITTNMEKCAELSKCRKCGCLQETLDGMKNTLLNGEQSASSELLVEVETALSKMEPTEYT